MRCICTISSRRLVDLQPHEEHRPIGIAAIERFELRRHEVEGVEAADPEPDMLREPEVAQQPERDLADVAGA